MSNTYNKLSEKVEQIYFDNLGDLGKEVAATMNVFHNVSVQSIQKTNLIASDILGTENQADYPLLWTSADALPTWTPEVESTAIESDDFNDALVNMDQMTYAYVG